MTFYVRRQLGGYLLHRRNDSIHAAARRQMDDGEAAAHKIVAHVHHIGLGKENDAVAVGVAAGEMPSADVLAMQVNRPIVIEGNDG